MGRRNESSVINFMFLYIRVRASKKRKIGFDNIKRGVSKLRTTSGIILGVALVLILCFVNLYAAPVTVGNFVVDYVISSSWGTGATISVTLENNGPAINGWTVGWTFPGNQTITNMWSATYTQSGASVTVKDAGFNASLPTGGSTNFGFNINYSGTNAVPTSFTVNSSSTTTSTPTQQVTPTPTRGGVTATPTRNATPTPTIPSSGPPYQAENAVYGGSAAPETTNSGYNGTGYINFPSSGGYLEFQNVNGGAGGAVTLKFRNALGASGSRTGRIQVNGGTWQNITFDPTGAWTTWTVKQVSVTLNSGSSNTIRLESTGQDLANIDELDLTVGGATSTPTRVATPTPTSTTATATPTPTRTNTPTPTNPPSGNARQMENLDRGVVAVKVSNGVFVSWRVLGTENSSVSYNLYRGSTKVNSSPLTVSNYLDSGGSTSSTYTVRAVVNGSEQGASPSVGTWGSNYLSIPLSKPSSIYSANDCSVGDLDGDHQYEIVLKWDPSDAKDNSQSGVTSPVYIDAYKLNGTRLWRINLGRNIRAGAHYTQFMVYDLDGDGKAEMVCKTADGTTDGRGTVIGSSSANYVNSDGYILSGPEYLTVFNGQTGAAMSTVNYEPARGTVSSWGDSYGNRVDRFLACVAYLDGVRPSVVMCRGYYTRAVLVAYDWRNGSLTKRWTFDSNSSGNSAYAGQGNHNLSVGDVDGDGRDEIVYGSCTIDDNGRGLYSTGLGHGDAMHLGDFNPDRPGLEVWQCHEGGSGATFRDARTGSVIFKFSSSGDVGRAMCDDMTSTRGCEMWAAGSSMYNCTGGNAGSTPSSCNFAIWWDGDLRRELLDGTTISKYGGSSLLSASGCASNNGTKSTPCLSADLLGDWREEVIFRTSDSSALRIYTTTTSTSSRIYTLMHDPQYRVSIAWQNVAYNQPPHVGFYLGESMSSAPTPNIYLAP
jgi:rhamnogalacturonan endolyase